MHRRSARQLLAATAAFAAVALLGACKTVRTGETWRQGTSNLSEMEKRWLKSSQKNRAEINALRSGDDDADYTHSQFDQRTLNTKDSLYGKKIAKRKEFRTKDFAGADEYQHGNYHFLKRQEIEAKTTRDQNQKFSRASAESTDAKKRFFWQRKKARTKEFAESDKAVRTREYRETKRSLERLESRDLNIVEDPARDAGESLTIDDVRKLLDGG